MKNILFGGAFLIAAIGGAGAAKTIWRFVDEVKPQHIVVANKGYNTVVGIGVVTSEYLSPGSPKNPMRKDTATHRHHVRLVNWLITDPVDLSGKQFFVQPTLWPLDNEKLIKIREAYAGKYPHLKTTLDQVLAQPLGGLPLHRQQAGYLRWRQELLLLRDLVK